MDLLCIEYLNLQAVERFICGDLVSTKANLLEALRRISELGDSVNSTKNNTMNGGVACSSLQFGKQDCLPSKSYSIRPVHDGEMFQDIYNAMFVLTTDVPVSVHETAAIILFNAALLHHRSAIHLNSSKEFNHALQIYMKVFDLFKLMSKQGNLQLSTLTVVMAALCHNMSHIFTIFRRANDTRSILSLLEQTLICLETNRNVVSDADFFFFQVNLRFARMDDFNLAPAA